MTRRQEHDAESVAFKKNPRNVQLLSVGGEKEAIIFHFFLFLKITILKKGEGSLKEEKSLASREVFLKPVN